MQNLTKGTTQLNENKAGNDPHKKICIHFDANVNICAVVRNVCETGGV